MTDETRFHALKFALQTPGLANAGAVLSVANDYHRFLTGAPDGPPPQPEPCCGENEACTSPTCTGWERQELDTMVTEGLEAAEAVVAEVAAEEAEAEGLPTNTDQIRDWLTGQSLGSAEWVFTEPQYQGVSIAAPTFEEVAAAVEEIASPPPPADSDPSDEPELTTEQCERYEDTVREADRVAVAPKEPEPEVQPTKPAWADYVS